MNCDIICFDCDSTLSKIEGIDELARRVGLGEEFSALTDAAMNGDKALEEIYAQRLALIQPCRADLDWLSERYNNELVEGVEVVFAWLAQHNKTVHIVSGGLFDAILPLAKRLNVPSSHLHAVEVYFDENGAYVGYDTLSPLTRNGGKAAVIKSLLSSRVVMVGDGQTDLEAQTVGAKVIGFGGVVSREIMRKQADFFIEDKNLTSILALLT